MTLFPNAHPCEAEGKVEREATLEMESLGCRSGSVVCLHQIKPVTVTKRREEHRKFKVTLGHMYSAFEASLRYRKTSKKEGRRKEESSRGIEGGKSGREMECWGRSSERRWGREEREWRGVRLALLVATSYNGNPHPLDWG